VFCQVALKVKELRIKVKKLRMRERIGRQRALNDGREERI